MDLLWNTVNTGGQNIARLLQARERREHYGKSLQQNCQFTASLLKRLGLQYSLEGHQGCVNCLQWSSDGRIIASGSDDTYVRIWDPFTNKCLHSIPTKHIGNIFSVKFVGDGSLVATGAGDCRVMVQSIEDSDRQAHVDCDCHVGRIKRLATAPDQPYIFWSAAEDGLILQYDLREPHVCSRNSTIFIDLSHTPIEFKCITVNPTKPHYIVAGANDSYARLYDRRMVRNRRFKPDHTFHQLREEKEPQDPNCVQYYAPGHLAKDNGGMQSIKLAATYVAFDSTGNELLVNLGGEHIYLYNINNERHTNELRIPECLPKINSTSPMKPCCASSDRKKEKNTHKYNYKLNNNNPCACDYMERAKRMYKRKWLGDVYFAARDYSYVIQHWPQKVSAYVGLINCLVYMKWIEESRNWIKHAKEMFPSIEPQLIKIWENHLDSIYTGSSDEETELAERKVTNEEKALRLDSMDYEKRYIGHCNTTTDIKEANFLGNNGDFICAGSDDGMIFIWDTKTTNLLTALTADVSIVNCVQPHPTSCCIASSGIDPIVKIWTPQNEDVDNYNNELVIKNPWVAVEANQERMSMNPLETLLLNMGYRVYRDELD